MSDLRCSFSDSLPTGSYHISEMNIPGVSIALVLCLVGSVIAESTTTTTPTPKKTRTVDKETYVPKEPANSPTNFGFVPVKTSDNYIQKEPSARYVYPDLLGQTQAYTSKYTNYEKPQYTYQSQSYQPQQSYQTAQSFRSQQTYQPQLAHYTQQQEISPYSLAQTQAIQYVYPQQYNQPSQDYSSAFEYQFSHPQLTQYYQEPSAKGVNYVSANVAPQYVHLQQPSNAIENVISPKDQGVRFIMFIPTYVPQQPSAQNYYTSSQSESQDYTTATVSQQPQQHQQVQYVYKTEPSVSPTEVSGYEKGPTSLLDSYVPSVVQLQYYKKLQAQSQANQIAHSEKHHGSKKNNDKYER